jgi:hypothetical protein
LAAQTPKPIFIQTRGETGLETLIDAGRLPQTPHFPEVQTWQELLGCVETLTEEDHDFRTLALDTINGAERLCHERVCERDFGGEWGDKGFAAYAKGSDVSLSEWRELLGALDKLRAKRKMTIVCLAHTKVAPFRNPEGADYDRYQADMNQKTWALTAKWADCVLFGNFDVTVGAVKTNQKTGEQKGKGTGGNARLMFTERHAAYDAKNRIGLVPEIEMGDSAAQAWSNFIAAVKAGRTQEVANG